MGAIIALGHVADMEGGAATVRKFVMTLQITQMSEQESGFEMDRQPAKTTFAEQAIEMGVAYKNSVKSAAELSLLRQIEMRVGSIA
ncbi:hypothetical protein ROA7450_02197 [Roseovarius albus]|uniref:Uncharacterized protein n=1 Tax=Roseovarius albus TaxID=1247867 RepID=A0A1X6Z9W3_9RHOB|nr:hypothetical protein [Roseovarius albus]SLN45501.1 hypothetical protein ROA7450_02197 [Roseovarius albus]